MNTTEQLSSAGLTDELAGTVALVTECRDALAEELAAWDIDPPLHHVKQAHDRCEAWLAARAASTTPPAIGLTDEQIEAGFRSFDWSSVPHPFRGSVGFERGARWAEASLARKRASASPAPAPSTQVVEPTEDLIARIAALEAELDEAKRGPWPAWAERILKLVRERSGYDGYDDQNEGVDLADEVEECLMELDRAYEKAAAQPAAPDKNIDTTKYWVAIAEASEALQSNCTEELAKLFCEAIDRLSSALSGETTECHEQFNAADAQQPVAPESHNEWQIAIDEAMTSAHIGVAEGDPRECLNRLLAWYQQVALDPAVSSEAEALIERGRDEERKRYAKVLEALRGMLEVYGVRQSNVYGGSLVSQTDVELSELARAALAEVTGDATC